MASEGTGSSTRKQPRNIPQGSSRAVQEEGPEPMTPHPQRERAASVQARATAGLRGSGHKRSIGESGKVLIEESGSL